MSIFNFLSDLKPFFVEVCIFFSSFLIVLFSYSSPKKKLLKEKNPELLVSLDKYTSLHRDTMNPGLISQHVDHNKSICQFIH